MRIKICGITRIEDAQAAVDFGADTLGFNAYPKSPRYIEPEAAAEIVAQLDPRPKIIGVFVRGFLEGIESNIWDAVQLHGYDHEADLPRLSVPVFAAASANSARNFPSVPVVIDESWGRGVKADWSALMALHRPFILSGGLNPENVAEAITACAPAGVDVCSGIERSPGIKDHEQMRLFIERAEGAMKQLEDTKVQQ